MSLYALSLTFFLVANPIGNTPAILALLKSYDFERQKKIMLRETLFALIIALFFQFFGEPFLGVLKISDYALSLAGGCVLFLVALQMLFHKPEKLSEEETKEPFIVPIAIPLISGPGLMTMIMVSAKKELNNWKIALALLIAWIGVTAVMLGAPYLQRVIGIRGMAALEQVMGLILGLIAIQMIVNGLFLFVGTL